MNYTKTKVDAFTSDLMFNFVLDTVYNNCYAKRESEQRELLTNQAEDYILTMGDDRYSAKELVDDFLDRI